ASGRAPPRSPFVGPAQRFVRLPFHRAQFDLVRRGRRHLDLLWCVLSALFLPLLPCGSYDLHRRQRQRSQPTLIPALRLAPLRRPLWLALASRIPSSRLIPNVLQREASVELLRHNCSLFGREESNYLRLRLYLQLNNLAQDLCHLITES